MPSSDSSRSARALAARLGAAAALALAAVLLPVPGGAGRAEAQTLCKVGCTPPAECPPEGCEDANPPRISINPEGASVQSPSLVVQITFYDLEGNAYGPGDAVLLNGAVVTPTHDGGSSTYVHQYTRTTSYWLRRGTNTLEVRSCDASGNCATRTASYVYTPPPPDTAYHAGDNVRVADGAATLSYTTPAYVSLDEPRSVSLFYASRQAAPHGLVRLAVAEPDTFDLAKLTVGLRRTDGTPVRLRVGSQEMDEVVLKGGDQKGFHFALQFDASTLATGAYDYTVVLRRWWPDGTFTESASPVRVLVVNERNSPFGAGWSIPGVQRLHLQSPAGVVLTEGDGSALFFARSGSGFTSPRGDFSTLAFDGANYRRRAADGTESVFHADGRLWYVRDRFGAQTTFGYSAAQLSSITDPAGKQITFGYGADGRLAWIRDPAGRVSRLTHTGGALTQILDPDSVSALQATYDAAHRATGWTSRGSGRWDVGYDEHGTLASLTAPAVTAGGRSMRPVTRFRSVEAALLPAAGSGTAAVPAAVSPIDAAGVRITDPSGTETWNAVDRFRLPTGSRTAEGFVTHTVRDEHGRPRFVSLHSADPSAGVRTTGYVYGDRRNPHPVLVVDYTVGDTLQTFYSPAFFQVDSIRRGGVTVLRNFRAGTLERLDSTWIRLADGTGAVTRYTWDAYGRLLTVTDANRRQTVYAYETTGLLNVRTVTRPASTGPVTTTFGYDALGRVTSVTDPTTQTVATEYDLLNRVRRVSGPLGGEARYAHDEAARAYTVTDARGQTYTSRFNALGWIESRTDPRGGVESFAYDSAGNVTAATNRRGQTVSTTYDALHRPLRVTADGRTTTFAYDPLRRWVAASNAESTDTLFVDEGTRPLRAVARRGGAAAEVRWEYDAQGRRALSQVFSGGSLRFVTEHRYGRDGRLVGVTAFGAPADVGYDAAGQPDSVRLPFGLGYTFGYTPGGALQSRRYALPGADAVLGRTYERDAMERITQVGVGGSAETRRLRYDALGRLSSARDYDGATLVRADTFTFDASGNRTDRGAVIETGNRLAQADGYALTYDADGNLTRKQKAGVSDQTFAWNALGQLVEVRDATGRVVSFGYDGWGRRVRKTVDGVTTRYLWDGDNLAAELDAAGGSIREYAYYPGIDIPYAMRRGSDRKVFFYQLEEPGHVAGVVDTANQVVNRYRYDPWGGARTTVEGVAQPLRYAAREWDAETGLYHFRARYYDPHLGRFVSEDPIGLEGGVNFYAYVDGDPANATDPSGLSPCDRVQGSDTYLCPAVGNGSPLPEFVYLSLLFGTGSGYGRRDGMNYTQRATDRVRELAEESTAYWAKRYVETGERKYAVAGHFAALGTEPDKTSMVLGAAWGAGRYVNRPYWRYVGPNANPNGAWLTRGWGWRAPYGDNFHWARSALQLPSRPTQVIRVNVPWYEPVLGPRRVYGNPQWGVGGGVEYFRTGYGNIGRWFSIYF